MHPATPVGELDPQHPRHKTSPISTLSNILIIPQRPHQRIKRLCNLTYIKPLLPRITRESKPWDRWRDNVEGLLPRGGVSQKREHFGDFVEMAWPAVREE